MIKDHEVTGGESLLGFGFEKFYKDIHKRLRDELVFDYEGMVEDLLNQARAKNDGDTVHCLLEGEFTKDNTNINYVFGILKEDEFISISYIGYEE